MQMNYIVMIKNVDCFTILKMGIETIDTLLLHQAFDYVIV